MSKILTKEEWRRKRRQKRRILLSLMSFLTLVIIILSIMLISSICDLQNDNTSKSDGFINSVKNRLLGYNNGIEEIDPVLSNKISIIKDYLTPNTYSRPQTPLHKVKGVVIHYTANPGTSAENNRSYFEGLAEKKTTYASSHYVIGLEGEVIQCIPLTEISYASNDRNNDTVAIECCIPDDTGKFNEDTYSSAVALTAALCVEFKLGKEDVIRHYDITGKCCPKYFVDHEDAWQTFKDDVMAEVEKLKAVDNNEKK